MTDEKSPAIRSLLQAIAATHGAASFPVDDWRPDSPNAICLTSGRDKRFAASVVALGDEPPIYSIMVELYGVPEQKIVPFEIAEDGTFTLSEAVQLFARYRSWRRAEDIPKIHRPRPPSA